MIDSNIRLLEELKSIYNINTYTEMAKRFDIPIKTINNWIDKKSIPSKGSSLQYIKVLIKYKKRDIEIAKKLGIIQEDIAQ